MKLTLVAVLAGTWLCGGLAFADHGESEDFEDVSTMEDGINPTECRGEGKHCVFIDRKTRLYWTSVTAREGASGAGELMSYSQAIDACKKLNNWGGFSDWRLSTFAELSEVRSRMDALGSRVPQFALKDTYFWTSSTIRPTPLVPIEEQDPEQAWAFHMKNGKAKQFRKAALFSWRCVREEFSKYWEDVSKKADGTTATKCESDSDQCVLKDKRTNLLWTEYSPGKRKLDPEHSDLMVQSDASAYCDSLRWGGLGGWRLPDVWELSRANANALAMVGLRVEHMGPIYGYRMWSRTNETHYSNINYYFMSLSYPQRYVPPQHTSPYPNSPVYANQYESIRESTNGYYNRVREKLPFLCTRAVPTAPEDSPPQTEQGQSEADEDGDGVPDRLDRCPGTPRGATVWKPGDTLPDGRDARPFWGCAGGQTPNSR